MINCLLSFSQIKIEAQLLSKLLRKRCIANNFTAVLIQEVLINALENQAAEICDVIMIAFRDRCPNFG